MKRISTYHFFIILLLFLASCSVQKKAYKAPLKEEGEGFLLSKMQENESKFETFSAKALVDIINDGKTTPIKVNIRIRKDSAIWVSISAGIGLEVARILLTNDTVMYLNRLEKSYFVGNYKFVNQMIHAEVNFDIVQSLLTGNDFEWYDYHNLKASISGDQYQLESAHRRQLKKYLRSPDCNSQVIYQSMWLNAENFKIERIKIKEIKNENKRIVAEYSDFINENGQKIPSQYNITISAQKEVMIDASLLKISLDKKLTFPFKIPSKYIEIQIQ